MRGLTIACAQMGPIQKADTRQDAVSRMLVLMDLAKAKGADLIVYPELALTTFFPRWYVEDQAQVDVWFERDMPNDAVRPLFERAAKYEMAMRNGRIHGMARRTWTLPKRYPTIAQHSKAIIFIKVQADRGIRLRQDASV